MSGQHDKVDVDLLSCFFDTELKLCSQMKQKMKCSHLCHQAGQV